MNREQFYELTCLYLTDELKPEQKINFENLLMEDDSLKSEFEKVKETLTLVQANKPSPVSEKALTAARQSLMREIRKEMQKPSYIQRALNSIRHYFLDNYKFAFGAAFTFVIGLCIGYISFSQRNSSSISSDFSIGQVANKDLNVSGISINPVNGGDGMVEVSYVESRPYQYKVTADNPVVQKLLIASLLTDNNPGYRLKTVNAIGKQMQENKIKDDPKVKVALITTLKTDENAAVRKEALLLLVNYQYDNDIRDSFLYVLSNDKNSGMRVAAINALASLKEKGQVFDSVVKEYLTQKAKNDNNDFIRIRAASML